MATILLTDGVNEREPTMISDGSLQYTIGAEYRVGETGLFCARGRALYGDVGSVTGVGLYEAGFDGSPGYVIAQQGNSLHAALISSSLSFSHVVDLAEGSSAITGIHYANRHYLASGVANKRLELGASGITSFPIGMSACGLSVAAGGNGSGSLSATTGLEYWVTEYDSARGNESIAGSTTNTGTISSVASVIVVATGTTSNPQADTLRWYRSVDGGGFPDGGLIQETAIGVTSITDTNTITGSLTVPLYGVVSVGGLDNERDEPPPVLATIFGPFNDSLLGVSVDDLRTLRFTPAGFPDSWPSRYGLPLDTSRRDEIVTGVILPGRAGVFCTDSVHVVFRLPRDSDSIFAAGEMLDPVTLERGCVSRRGATVFTPPGGSALAAFVSRDGIWACDLTSSPLPLTDRIDWDGRVSIADLSGCRLQNDPQNRRLVFTHRKLTDTTYNTGVWYLDYQHFNDQGIRITFADHGPLADTVTIGGTDGKRTLISIDSRESNGQVYQESTQDEDDSHLLDSSGSVRFKFKTKEFLPGGPTGAVDMGVATWMHDAGPSRIEHRFYFDRRDDNPEMKLFEDPDERTATDVVLNRQVNSFSLELQSVGTQSYGVHWLDIEALELHSLGARKGA